MKLLWNNNSELKQIKNTEECSRLFIDVEHMRVFYNDKIYRDYEYKNLILVDVNGRYGNKPNAIISREVFNQHRRRINVLNLKYLTKGVIRAEII